MNTYIIIDHDTFGYTQAKPFDDLAEAVEFAVSFAESRLIDKVELYQYDDVLGYLLIKRYKG